MSIAPATFLPRFAPLSLITAKAPQPAITFLQKCAKSCLTYSYIGMYCSVHGESKHQFGCLQRGR
jgi:hypothetical protein